ncbi:DnaJ domain-containing protein [Candidatus Daviesbacteria bacterium]|nr:DnaJ domain-containing protein [Candidatus Daviesbacteria bacterium]
MAKKDYYEVLGIPKSAPDAEIKSAYRKLARKHHPDIDKSPGSAEKFKEISEAYQVLSDSSKRKTYDQFGHSAFGPGASGFGGPSGAGFGEGFNPFGGTQGGPFGQGGFSYSWSSSGGQGSGGFVDPFDLFEQIFGGGFAEQFSQGFRRRQSFQMDLTFDEAVHGVTKDIEIERIEGNSKRTRERMTIKVPAGVDNGTRMRFGDVDIVFRVKRHSEFLREGADIFTERILTIPQVVLGDTIEVNTIDGKVKVKVPGGTEAGALIRLKGKGVFNLRGGRGDHFVRVRLEVPKSLSAEEKELYQTLASLKPKKKGWF